MKYLKLFEDFSGWDPFGEEIKINPEYSKLSTSDRYIAESLDKLKIPFKIGKDKDGNDGVFITDEILISKYHTRFEIYSTNPDRNYSDYHTRYYIDDILVWDGNLLSNNDLYGTLDMFLKNLSSF